MFRSAGSIGRRRVLISLLAVMCGRFESVAAGAGEPALLAQARQALAESVPQIAVFKLRTLLAAAQLAAPERNAAAELLGEAQLAAGQAEAALQTIKGLTAAGDAKAGLLRANILASQGRWAEARRLFRRAAPEFPVAAALGESEALEALGWPEKAASALEPLVQRGQGGPLVSIRLAILLCELHQARRADEILTGVKTSTVEEAKWKVYAEGRALLVEEQPAPALEIFEKLLQEREHLPEALFVAATFGKTDARVALNGTEAADDVLEDFIWHNPGSAYLEAAFKRLYQVYVQEDSARESELQGWALRPQTRRAKLALYYVAKLQAHQRRFDRAEQSLEWFLRAYKNDPLAREAHLLRGEVYTAAEKFDEATRSWEAAERLTQDQEERGVIELQRGLAHFRKREFLEAARRFEEAGRLSQRARAAASFDAALAWLNEGEFERYHDQDTVIFQIEPESPLSGELMLEQGLAQARTGAVGATAAAKSLSGFLQDFPRHARAPEAELALAELAFLGGEMEGARAAADQYVRIAEKIPAGEELNAQADWMGIWLADAARPRDDEKVISLGLAFLRKHGESPHRIEVRMKLGEVYFRRGDFANAETQFAELAAADPASPYAEAALFLAGQASTKLIGPGAVDQALAFFDRVIHSDGRFKLYARQEQAVIQNRLGHEDQAIELYDIILRAQPEPDPELRAAALCGKGDNLLTLGRKEWPKTERLEQAVTVFDQLAGDPRASANWRNQAGYKKGKAFEQMGRIDDSLAAYYDVLNGEAVGQPEYFWYYKAGFDAAHAFEQQEQWRSAIGIYQKMTKLEGPRTAEAKSRMRQLRLEHFIWD